MKTKSEKRELIAHKTKISQHKGGATLAGQISRTKVNKNYSGHVKKISTRP